MVRNICLRYSIFDYYIWFSYILLHWHCVHSMKGTLFNSNKLQFKESDHHSVISAAHCFVTKLLSLVVSHYLWDFDRISEINTSHLFNLYRRSWLYSFCKHASKFRKENPNPKVFTYRLISISMSAPWKKMMNPHSIDYNRNDYNLITINCS